MSKPTDPLSLFSQADQAADKKANQKEAYQVAGAGLQDRIDPAGPAAVGEAPERPQVRAAACFSSRQQRQRRQTPAAATGSCQSTMLPSSDEQVEDAAKHC